MNKRPSGTGSSRRPVALRVYTRPECRSNSDWSGTRSVGRRNCMFGRMLKSGTTAGLAAEREPFATHKLRRMRVFRRWSWNWPRIARQLGNENFYDGSDRSVEADWVSCGRDFQAR